jgi:hypothetical protein
MSYFINYCTVPQFKDGIALINVNSFDAVNQIATCLYLGYKHNINESLLPLNFVQCVRWEYERVSNFLWRAGFQSSENELRKRKFEASGILSLHDYRR